MHSPVFDWISRHQPEQKLLIVTEALEWPFREVNSVARSKYPEEPIPLGCRLEVRGVEQIQSILHESFVKEVHASIYMSRAWLDFQQSTGQNRWLQTVSDHAHEVSNDDGILSFKT